MNTPSYFVRLIIALYAIVMVLTMVWCLPLKRKVLLTNREEFGVAVIQGVKYRVPFRDQTVMPTFSVDDPLGYLFLSNGEDGGCLVGALLKLGICVMLQIVLWNFDINDPFNKRHIKYFRFIIYLLIALLASDFVKNVYTSNWAITFKGGLNGYQYKVPYNFSAYIIILFILSVVITAYRRAVKNQRELELVI
jgi:hypothetical protein